jgi:hypothetical protein
MGGAPRSTVDRSGVAQGPRRCMADSWRNSSYDSPAMSDGRGDEGEARARFTEAQATAERRRDGDGGQWCFSDGEGTRGCARERGKEWGRCGDQRGAMRPISNAGGRSAGVENSVMAGSGEYRGRRE